MVQTTKSQSPLTSSAMSLCYHCNLDIPATENYHLCVLGKQRSFCCPGCLAIAETICNSGLDNFYRFRSKRSNKAETILPQELIELEAFDTPAILNTITKNKNNSNNTALIITVELGIEGITCAACGWLLRKQISKRPEVKDIQVNTNTRRAIIRYAKDAQLSPILKNIRQLGYHAYPFCEDKQEKQLQKENSAYIRRLIIAGLGMMQIMMFATGVYLGDFQDISEQHAYFLHLVSGVIATPVIAYSALPFFKNAWNALKYSHFGMDLPVSIAILSGYTASLYSLVVQASVFYFDSVVMFTFFLIIGRYLEHRMRLKAILKQQSFNRLLPWSANLKNADASVNIISVGEIKPGDHLIINAGCTVPVDGVLLDENAELNEAIITGEFLPVCKKKGDSLISGSSNSSASFVMQATTEVQNSRLQKLIELQNNTETLSFNVSSVADKIANGYVIGLLCLAFATGIIWWQIDPTQIFPVILSLLVVSCPCALSLATPTAIAAAIASLTDKGLMIKSRQALSKMSKITDIFFDKTGTLTLGKMTLVKVLSHHSKLADEKTCIQIAALMESVSNHPIAEAFKRLKIKPIAQSASVKMNEVIACGVQAELNSDIYRLGKANFVIDKNEVVPNQLTLQDQAIDETESTRLPLYLTKNNQHIATFLLSDEINQSAYPAINLLKNAYNISVISGDSKQVTAEIAKQLKVSHCISNATPESKLQHVLACQQAGKHILMIGDGVNDIGALSQSDVGITLGNASHLSKAAASAVLIGHDLTVIHSALKIAKKLKRIIIQNLSWAVLYNITAIPFAMAGLIPAWLAAIGMSSSSLIVVLNALRLRNTR